MKKLRISKIRIAVIVVAVISIAAWALSGGKEKEEINFKQDQVALKTLQNSVTATGTIEAVTSVTVGTQVSGIVSKLYVDYNTQVKKGQVIAELDKTNLMSELNIAKANLASAQSALKYQTANMERYQTLFKKGLVSADEYENAMLTYRQAKEQTASSRERTESADQSGLRHHHLAHRRHRDFQERGGRPDRGCQFQHPRALHHRQGPYQYAGGSQCR